MATQARSSYNAGMFKITHFRFLPPVLVGIVLLCAASGVLRAQHSSGPPIIRFLVTPMLNQDAQAMSTRLQDSVRQALAAGDLQAELQVEHPSAAPEISPPAVGEAALMITLRGCPDDRCLLNVAIGVNAPPSNLLISDNLLVTLANEQPIRLELTAAAGDDILQFIGQLVAGLFGYSMDACPEALPLLDNTRADSADMAGIANAYLLDFYRALCLREAHDYGAALNALDAMRAALADADAPWQLFRLCDIYTADSLAQSFAFDHALAWDDHAIMLTRAHHSPTDPIVDQLLAELYLLRGQHRLYLYEWDTVLADYNTALTFPHAPARAYYYRGLLYYTQNARRAAYDDLTRYLALETDEGPLTERARQYVADLERLLATPGAE